MRTIFLLILSFIVTWASAQADRTFIRQGNKKFREGEYQQAEIEYRKALEKDPAAYRADYNLGNALYKQKQYDAAISKYSTLAKNETDRQKLNRYFYNLGNAFFESTKYKESAEAYKNALRNDPGDMNAKHNLMLALKMLDQSRQQQNDKENENKDNQQNDQQNKENGNRNQQDQQNKEGRDEEQQAQPQQVKGQISPEDAERILQALENEEKKVMDRVQEQKQHARKASLEKNW